MLHTQPFRSNHTDVSLTFEVPIYNMRSDDSLLGTGKAKARDWLKRKAIEGA